MKRRRFQVDGIHRGEVAYCPEGCPNDNDTYAEGSGGGDNIHTEGGSEENNFKGSRGEGGFNMESGSGEDSDRVRILHRRSLRGEWEVVDCMIPHTAQYHH